jgi:hypothetical protein
MNTWNAFETVHWFVTGRKLNYQLMHRPFSIMTIRLYEWFVCKVEKEIETI